MPGRAPSAGYQVRTSEAILKHYGEALTVEPLSNLLPAKPYCLDWI